MVAPKGKGEQGWGIQHSGCNNYAYAPKQRAHQLIGGKKVQKNFQVRVVGPIYLDP
jgi:hypothetical protein